MADLRGGIGRRDPVARNQLRGVGVTDVVFRQIHDETPLRHDPPPAHPRQPWPICSNMSLSGPHPDCLRTAAWIPSHPAITMNIPSTAVSKFHSIDYAPFPIPANPMKASDKIAASTRVSA